MILSTNLALFKKLLIPASTGAMSLCPCVFSMSDMLLIFTLKDIDMSSVMY